MVVEALQLHTLVHAGHRGALLGVGNDGDLIQATLKGAEQLVQLTGFGNYLSDQGEGEGVHIIRKHQVLSGTYPRKAVAMAQVACPRRYLFMHRVTGAEG